MNIVKASAADAGCWIDGHWGQYGVTRLIEIARDYGCHLEGPTDTLIVGEYLAGIEESAHCSGGSADWVFCLADECEDWLNQNVAPKAFYFEWVDGEFFLSPATEDED